MACKLPDAMQGPAEDPCLTVVREDFGGAVERSVLTTHLRGKLGCSEDAARMRISRAVRQGRLQLSDDGREISIPW